MCQQTILVTGGAGFIGSNFIPYFLSKYNNYRIINIDKLTYAGTLDNLEEVDGNQRYKFIKGDICNYELLQQIFSEYNVTGVIHFAAESHVDNSIKFPGSFVQSNIVGTFNLLEVARQYWMTSSKEYKTGFNSCRFLHISTDEVFGSLGDTDFFTENSQYAPNSPYSASKASSDMLVRSYHHTYGLNVLTTNCSNNYGPKQHAEKLIPTIIRNASEFQPIPIYGNGKNVRDWLFVLDHCRALDIVFHRGRVGETYCIGGDSEKTNIEIAQIICEILDELIPYKSEGTTRSYKKLITFVADRPGHDHRYAIDASKIKSELGWAAQVSFAEGISNTVSWYVKKYKNRNARN